MDQIGTFYWQIAIGCCIVGLLFFFITTDGLIKGKLKLPAWVFSTFTLVIGVFFFKIFVNSMNEFNQGGHESIDQLFDAWHLVSKFFS